MEEIVAKNIAYYRKKNNLTQFELAEKLNYSDKSISKWERAESLPDIIILKKLADLFKISVNDFFVENNNKTVSPSSKIVYILITCLSVILVWFIATISFVLLKLFSNITLSWICFIYAIPISSILLIIFSKLWFTNLTTFISVSILVWSTVLSIFLSINYNKIWLVFILAIPMQILTILWFILKKRKSKR